MRGYYRTIIILLVLIAAAAIGLIRLIMTTPLGPSIEYQALPGDYTGYWNYILPFGVIALGEGLAIIILLAVIVWKIWR